MDLDKIYVLNPAYFLRNDIHRAVIGTFDYCDMDSESFDDSFAAVIHPANAQMLAFFDGVKKLGECIHDLAEYFGLTETEISEFVEPYIENQDKLLIKFNDHPIWFPKNVLIENKNYTRRENYIPEQFKVDGKVDLDSV